MNKTVEWLWYFADENLKKFITDNFWETPEDVLATRVYADILNTLEELWRSDMMAETQNAWDELHFNYIEQEYESRRQRKGEDYIEESDIYG